MALGIDQKGFLVHYQLSDKGYGQFASLLFMCAKYFEMFLPNKRAFNDAIVTVRLFISRLGYTKRKGDDSVICPFCEGFER